MNRYTTIFFDLDNTLLDFYASEKKAIKQVLTLFSLPSDDETALLYSKINKSFWERYERGEIKRDEIFAGRFKVLLETLGRDGDPEKMTQEYFGFLSAGHDKVDGADECLFYLKSRGYKIYATSNGVARTQYRRISEAEMDKYFDGVFVSETVGCQKPERAYFDFVIDNIPEKDRSKILVIGDSQSSDILGGINAGLDTCWYRHPNDEQKYESTYIIDSLNEIEGIL